MAQARRSKSTRSSLSMLPARRKLRRPFVLAVVAIAAGLGLGLWEPSREWAWDRLAFGWIPTVLWLAAFIAALRYRRLWIKEFWRDWLGSALAIAATLGLLSLFNTSWAGLEDASLGGYWGQTLGGSPTWLGVLKVVVLFVLIPPIISPRIAGGAYMEGARDVLIAVRALLSWARVSTPIAARWLWTQTRAFSGHLVPRRKERHAVAGTPDLVFEPPRLQIEPEATAEFLEEPTPPPLPPSPVREDNHTKQKDHGPAKIYGWHLPSLELLEKPEAQASPRAAPEQMAEHIVNTLAEHGVQVTVKDIRVGPRVIRFGLVPGWTTRGREAKGLRSKASNGLPTPDSTRVKVQSIIQREKDLALALKTPHIRLEAPVPGEAIVGLEVPNPYPCKVALRAVAECSQFQKISAKGGLPVSLGQDTAGDPVVVDLLDMPHLLIAGATGSGKSVCINTVIVSLLLTNRPDRVRLLMIDPKRVELTPFNGIPHLVTPVIVEPDEVLKALKGLVSEMMRRYRVLEEVGARNIEAYNRKSKEHMPFLVVVIDELADLMMAAAVDVEQVLVRLAQLGRATGVHLLLATQRPSVNVVTGLIKANIPARIAFAVASQVDSRVVLDGAGAEKLLGKGDMLFLSQESPKPRRVQGALIMDAEIEKLVDFWKAQSGPPLPPVLLPEDGEDIDDTNNDLEIEFLDKARDLAQRLPQVSPSLLQRRLQIGYSQAQRLIEALDEEGLSVSRGSR